MSQAQTTCIFFPLTTRDGSDFEAPKGSHERRILDVTPNLLHKQPGFQNGWMGTQLENQDTLSIFVEWASEEYRQGWAKTADHNTWVGTIAPAGDMKRLRIMTVKFTSPVAEALSSPVVEVALWYFPADARPDSFTDNWNEFRRLADTSGKAHGLHADASGWVQKFLMHQGEERSAYCCVVGWESKEAHMAYRETDEFKSSIGKLREQTVGVEMFHVQIKQRSWGK